MLKSLFNKIKSEKSSTIKNEAFHKENDFKQNDSFEGYDSITLKDQTQLGIKLIEQSQSEQSFIKSQIKQARYWVNQSIPNIFTKVLSCPISHYNLLPHSQRKVKEIDLKKDKFPEYLNFIKPLLEKQLSTFNHLLINHYPRGIGIMHHFDGPMYKDKVVVLSLGGPALISFQENYKKESQGVKILLEDKSIHIFEQDAYQKYLHGIEDNKVDVITFTIFEGICEKKTQTNNMIKLNSSKKEKNEYWIGQSSIKNMSSVKSIHEMISNHVQRLTFQEQVSQEEKHCFEFNQYQGYSKLKGCFIYIRPDQNIQEQSKNGESILKSYRWKMQIERQQRISITIRQQYSDQFLAS